MAQLNFDATNVPQADVIEALPAGWYNVVIEESENKPTKDAEQTGHYYLQLRLSVIDGQYANRKIFVRMNIGHSNPTTKEIAYKNLSSLCHAIGILQVPDSTVLHGRPFKVKVKVRAAQGDFEASNEPTAYKNINEVVDMGHAAAPAPAAPWAPPAAPAPVAPPAPAYGAPAGYAAPAAPAPVQQWQPPQAQQPWAPPAQQAPAAPMQQAPAQQPPMQQAPAAPAPQPQAPAQQPGQPQVAPPWMQNAAAGQAPGGVAPWQQGQQ